MLVLAVATVEVALATPDHHSQGHHHDHHEHNHVAPHQGAEDDYVLSDNSYFQYNYPTEYTIGECKKNAR